MKGNSICGRKRAKGFDFYQTPEWAIERLLNFENFQGEILEPCSGAGAISKVLERSGYLVVSSDIREDNDVYGTKGVDIFSINKKYDNVITNPPYCIAQKVVEKALGISNRKIAMLLKLNFLEGQGRYEFFKRTPLKFVYVFSKRIQMYPEGMEKPKNGGTIAFAWFVWEQGFTDPPTIKWIKN